MNPAIVRWGDWWEAFELRWPRPGYTILETPRGDWGEAWRALERKVVLTRDLEAVQAAEPWWEFERQEIGAEIPWLGPQAVLRVAWPPGGVFVPDKDPATAPTYAPLTVAADILLDVQHTGPEDPEAVLAFVNCWGRLGVGIHGAPDFPADSALFTAQWLEQLTQWLRALDDHQKGREATMSPKALADALGQALQAVHIAARPGKRLLVPCFPVPTLLDALCLEIWNTATSARRLRRCPECEALFIHGRQDKRFCTGRCARRWTARLWKRKRRAALRRKRAH